MKRWTLSMMIGLIVLEPAFMAANDQPSLATGKNSPRIIAQSTSTQQNPTDQAWELIRTAQRYAVNGQVAQASETLVQAEQRTRLLSNSVITDQLLTKIVAEQAKLGRYDRAIAITSSMSYTTLPQQACCIPFRTEAETAIVEAYLKAGQVNQARQFAEGLQAASRNQVLVPIVAHFADQGQFTESINLSRRITDGFQSSRGRYAIIKGYVNADRVTEALNLTKTVTDKTERSALLTTLTQWIWRSGRYDLAYRIASQIQDAGSKSQALIELAIAHANVGQRERALTILSQAYQIARTQREFSPSALWVGNFAQIGAFDRALTIANGLEKFAKADARLAIARAYSNAGQYARAIAMAQLVRDGELQPFGDLPDPKVATLNQIVMQAVNGGQPDLALRAVQALDQGKNRVKPLRTIAQHYRKTSQLPKAVTVLNQAVAAAKTVDRISVFYDRNTGFSVSNAGLLIDIAQDYLTINQPNLATAVLDAAIESARILKDPNVNSVQYQVRYLSTIAKLYSQLGQSDRALVAAESAFTLVDLFPRDPQSPYYPFWKVQALADTAQTYHLAGASSRASEVLSGAERLSDTITDTQQRVLSLIPIVQAYAATDQEVQVKATVTRVLQLVSTLDASRKDWLTDRLAVAAASSNSTDALQLVQTLPDRARQIPVLAEIAVKHLAANQNPQAQTAVARLQQIASQIPDEVQSEQVLNDAIRSYFVPQGIQDRPIEQYLLAGQINAEIRSPNAKAANWSSIALAYANQGEITRARETMKLALTAAGTIVDRFERHDLLWQMLEEILRVGERDLATQVANGFEDASYRTTALQQVNRR